MMPKKKLTASGFAVGVLLRAVGDAALAPARAEAEKHLTEWLAAAKAQYIERCGDSIPPEAAEECAETCYSLNCMTGTPGNYRPKPYAEWPDPVAAADEDMARWAQAGEAA